MDAYYWVKSPGESDGCSATLADGSHCVRYDPSCGLDSSLSPAPEAGEWFPALMLSLIANGIPSTMQAVVGWEGGSPVGNVSSIGAGGAGVVRGVDGADVGISDGKGSNHGDGSQDASGWACVLLLPLLCIVAFVAGRKYTVLDEAVRTRFGLRSRSPRHTRLNTEESDRVLDTGPSGSVFEEEI